MQQNRIRERYPIIIKESESILVLPRLSIGAENRLTEWLMGCIGYFRDTPHSTHTVTTYDNAGDKSEIVSDTTNGNSTSCLPVLSGALFTLGFGVHIDRFSIDWAMSAEVLRSLLKADLAAKNAQVYVSVILNHQLLMS